MCEYCRAVTELTIHHGYYRPKGDPWDYEDETLWILCWECHKKIQAQLILIHRAIGRMHPKELEKRISELNSLIFKQDYGISEEEAEEIVKEERAIAATLYAAYSVTLIGSSEYGPTIAYVAKADAEEKFPGIDVDVLEEDGYPNFEIVSVDGPDARIRSEVRSWFEGWI
jgi:hypothetical protein